MGFGSWLKRRGSSLKESASEPVDVREGIEEAKRKALKLILLVESICSLKIYILQ